MRCNEVEGLLAGRALGELPSAQAEEMDLHLQACEDCSVEFEQVQQALGMLDTLEPAQPSEELLGRTLAVLEEHRSSRGLRERLSEFYHWFYNLQITPMRGTVAAALGLFLFVAFRGSGPALVATPGVEASCQENVAALGQAAVKFRELHSGQAPDELPQLVPGFIAKLPECPLAGTDTYSQGYVREAGSQEFEIHCHGAHHKEEGLDANSPRYTSQK